MIDILHSTNILCNQVRGCTMIIDEAQSGTNHGNKQSKPFGFSMNTNLGIRTKADSSCETILSITIDQLRVFIIANTTLSL